MNKPLALRRNSAIALAVSSVLAGGTPAARAQDASTAALAEVVVTATRREQSIQDIPFNISALGGEALEKANIIEAVEALRTMPGISVQDRGHRNAGVTSSIVIRGINVDSGTQGDVPLAAPATVSTYVDDTPLYGNFILKDIERIEVLRGPQGTLYGSGSLAGNVRYIMRKPDLSGFSGEASVGYGQTDGSDGYNLNPDIMLNMPVGETFAVRLNAGMIDNDGIVDYPNVYELDGNGDPVVNGDVLTALPVYTSVKDADDVDIKYGRVSALFAPNDVFSAQLSYQFQDDEVGGRRQVTSGADLVNGGQYGKYEFGGIQLEPSERDVELTALELEVDLGFATLTSSTSHYEHTGTGISDNSGVYARNGWFVFYGSSPRPIAQAERFYDDSAVVQELRLVSNGDGRVDWTAGFFYMDQDYDLGQNSYPGRVHPLPRRAELVRHRTLRDQPGLPVPSQPEIRGDGAVRRGDVRADGQPASHRRRPLLRQQSGRRRHRGRADLLRVRATRIGERDDLRRRLPRQGQPGLGPGRIRRWST